MCVTYLIIIGSLLFGAVSPLVKACGWVREAGLLLSAIYSFSFAFVVNLCICLLYHQISLRFLLWILQFHCVLTFDGLIVTTPADNLRTCVCDYLRSAIKQTHWFTHTEEDVSWNAYVCLVFCVFFFKCDALLNIYLKDTWVLLANFSKSLFHENDSLCINVTCFYLWFPVKVAVMNET